MLINAINLGLITVIIGTFVIHFIDQMYTNEYTKISKSKKYLINFIIGIVIYLICDFTGVCCSSLETQNIGIDTEESIDNTLNFSNIKTPESSIDELQFESPIKSPIKSNNYQPRYVVNENYMEQSPETIRLADIFKDKQQNYSELFN